MSTLNVANISTTNINSVNTNGTGTEKSRTQAWSNVNGFGTIYSRDSLNIASLTDTDSGTMRHNFTNSMSSDSYVISQSSNSWLRYMDTQTTNGINTTTANSGFSNVDVAFNWMTATGNLA